MNEAEAQAIAGSTRLKIMLEGYPSEHACPQVPQMFGLFWYCNPSVIYIYSYIIVFASSCPHKIVGYTHSNNKTCFGTNNSSLFVGRPSSTPHGPAEKGHVPVQMETNSTPPSVTSERGSTRSTAGAKCPLNNLVSYKS